MLYSLENKEEIITILKTRLVLGEGIPTREIILRSEKNETQLKNLGVLNKLKFKCKKLTTERKLEVAEAYELYFFDKDNLMTDENNNIYFNVYNFIEKYEDKNLTDLYLTKDKKQLYFVDRFRKNNNFSGSGSSIWGSIANQNLGKVYNSNTVFALEPDDNKMLIEFIADITLEKNLKDKKSAGYFDF